MAWTETQKAQVRLYLGWPARFWQTDSRLEQAMNAVNDKAEELALCTALLTSLADIDTRITACYTRLKALKVGKIELPGAGELGALRSEGKRLSARLALTLGVAMRPGVWGGGGPSAFSSDDGPEGGNYVKQGS